MKFTLKKKALWLSLCLNAMLILALIIHEKQVSTNSSPQIAAAGISLAPPAERMFAISPTKMNVFYIGVDNPVEMAVSGIAAKDLNASITHGSIKQSSDGGNVVRLNAIDAGKVATIQLSSKINGKQQIIGSREFRVKLIPSPVATLGGKYKGGKVSTTKLSALGGIVPDLGNFDFDVKFQVIGFTMLMAAGDNTFRETGTGPLITREMVQLIRSAKKGNLIIFDDIKVRGPDGTTRKLQSITAEIL